MITQLKQRIDEKLEHLSEWSSDADERAYRDL